MSDKDEDCERDARAVAEAYVAEDWRAIRARFDETMDARLSERALAGSWRMLCGVYGRPALGGAPMLFVRGDYRVVDVPLTFHRGFLRSRFKIRVTYDDRFRVAGLFVLKWRVA